MFSGKKTHLQVEAFHQNLVKLRNCDTIDDVGIPKGQ